MRPSRQPPDDGRRRTWRHRPWRTLSIRSRAAIVVLSAGEIVLTTVAAIDLYRQPARGVRGPKALWWPAIFVQPVGPLAYLTVGRGPRPVSKLPTLRGCRERAGRPRR